ncbi:Inner membrane protein YbjJ [Baekduia alba]|uniref:MFS transporter n=1 Tax=Baekduia alba TaxID=2997333 RepID=UPI002340CAFC|nr:MFS transporter [Baekduia alba]WCB94773.1 Inner membrane protein YbjJ [Baekduia alba]
MSALTPSPRAAVTTIFLLNGALLGTWGARIPAIQDGLDTGPGGIAVALAALAAGALIAMPTAGRLVSGHGSATVVRIAVAVLGLGLVAPAVMPSVGLLAASTFVLGLANGALDVSMNVQGVEVERRARRAIFSSMHAAFSAGGLVGAGIAALAAATDVGATANFLVVGLAAAAVGEWVSRSLVADSQPAPEAAHASPAGTTSGRWKLGGLAFCCLFAEGAAMDWSAVHLRAIGAGAAVAALAYAAYSIAMASGRLTGDRLSERLGPVTLARRGGLLAGLAMTTSLVVGDPAVGLLAYILLGAGLSVITPMVFRAAATGGDAGPALAAVTTTGYLGLLAGPPIIGAVASVTSVPTSLVLVIVAAACVVVGAGALAPPSGRVAAAPLSTTSTPEAA